MNCHVLPLFLWKIFNFELIIYRQTVQKISHYFASIKACLTPQIVLYLHGLKEKRDYCREWKNATLFYLKARLAEQARQAKSEADL
jgi:hypothetical protein